MHIPGFWFRRLPLALAVVMAAGHLPAESPGKTPVFPLPEASVRAALGERTGTVVMLDCRDGGTSISHPEWAAEKLPPCSTFKIWNTLIGAECGLLTSRDQAFYQWDGEKRFLPEWNQDLTLSDAFRVSCVPAFQKLARDIGPDRMRVWVERLGYGDRNLSAGLDVFWLPADGRETLRISAREQAEMLVRLVSKKLPVQEKSITLLREIMLVRDADGTRLFGKTGSGSRVGGTTDIGWFVGWIERDDATRAFACLLKGPGASGKEARGVMERLLEASGY